MLLSFVPEIQGREAAGVSAISSGQAPPTTTIAAPPAASALVAARRPRGAIHSHAAPIPGTTSSPAPIFVSNASPTETPARTIQRVRPSCSARTVNHSAATVHSASRASGLLWREIATVTGVTASTRPATKPAGRPHRRRVRS